MAVSNKGRTRRISTGTIRSIIGVLTGEVGTYLSWRLLGVIPDWIAYMVFIALVVVWLTLYIRPRKDKKQEGQPISKDVKRAFKLAIKRELRELVDSISKSERYTQFLPEEWTSHKPSEGRLLLDSDHEWQALTDFYHKLEQRNEHASYYSADFSIPLGKTMIELNEECVELGKKALSNVKWE